MSISRRVVKLAVLITNLHCCHSKREAMWKRLCGWNLKACHVYDLKHWEWVGLWWAWHAHWLWFFGLEKRGKLPFKVNFQQLGKYFCMFYRYKEIYRWERSFPWFGVGKALYSEVNWKHWLVVPSHSVFPSETIRLGRQLFNFYSCLVMYAVNSKYCAFLVRNERNGSWAATFI